jgi:hypothetical protein
LQHARMVTIFGPTSHDVPVRAGASRRWETSVHHWRYLSRFSVVVMVDYFRHCYVLMAPVSWGPPVSGCVGVCALQPVVPFCGVASGEGRSIVLLRSRCAHYFVTKAMLTVCCASEGCPFHLQPSGKREDWHSPCAKGCAIEEGLSAACNERRAGVFSVGQPGNKAKRIKGCRPGAGRCNSLNRLQRRASGPAVPDIKCGIKGIPVFVINVKTPAPARRAAL